MDECQHRVLRKITYIALYEAEYICADDDHPECHKTFKVVPS